MCCGRGLPLLWSTLMGHCSHHSISSATNYELYQHMLKTNQILNKNIYQSAVYLEEKQIALLGHKHHSISLATIYQLYQLTDHTPVKQPIFEPEYLSITYHICQASLTST